MPYGTGEAWSVEEKGHAAVDFAFATYRSYRMEEIDLGTMAWCRCMGVRNYMENL